MNTVYDNDGSGGMSGIFGAKLASARMGIGSAVGALGLLAAAFFPGCGDNRVAGTSSGVDNPQITLAFQDTTGTALRLSGDLNVFAADQNPAVDPQPLWTLKLKETALANLTGEDIARINVAAKTSASAGSFGGSATALAKTAADPSLSFTLQLSTDDQRGMVAFDVRYDTAAKIFTSGDGARLSRLVMQPRALIRFSASISAGNLAGTVSRIFIPGTPYQATLVESTFVFENLPPGIFPLRLLGADGHIFAMQDSLDTKLPSHYTALPHPISQLDSTHLAKLDSGFAVDAGPNRETFLETPAPLEATILGADPYNPALSILWRQLQTSADSSAPVAVLAGPTSLRCEVAYPAEGTYAFEASATLGLRSVHDTVSVSVRHTPPPPRARFIQPHPGQILFPGRPFTIQWEMPVAGPVSLRFSSNGGEKWTALVEHYTSPDSLPVYAWTPSPDLAGQMHCKLQVRLDADTTLTALTDSTFGIAPLPQGPPPGQIPSGTTP